VKEHPLVRNDDPQLLDFLEAALNLQPTEYGFLDPKFDPSALLALSDWLEERDDPRAADVREFGRARFFIPVGGPGPGPRPIACGAWWNISLLHEQDNDCAITWAVYPGTDQYDRLVRYERDEASRRLYWGLLIPRRRVWPHLVRSDTRLLAWHYGQTHFWLAASLFDTSLRFIECRHKLLRGNDDEVTHALTGAPEVLRAQLRRRDPQRYRRLLRRERAYWARELAMMEREEQERAAAGA
jgi:hypothetical protein